MVCDWHEGQIIVWLINAWMLFLTIFLDTSKSSTWPMWTNRSACSLFGNLYTFHSCIGLPWWNRGMIDRFLTSCKLLLKVLIEQCQNQIYVCPRSVLTLPQEYYDQPKYISTDLNLLGFKKLLLVGLNTLKVCMWRILRLTALPAPSSLFCHLSWCLSNSGVN